MLYSVIVPAYNESEVIAKSYQRLKKVMDSLGSYELIFVDDGSADGTLGILRKIAAEDITVRVISFSRNFGHQTAVTAGMAEAAGDAAIIIDADLQDPPELIPELVKKWEEGYKVVYARRVKREGETLFKKATASLFYRVMARLSGVSLPKDAGDFRLLDRAALDAINSMPEHNRYLRGLSAWAGFSCCPVDYVREKRAAGHTKYTLKKMLRLASDGIVSQSARPLAMLLKLGVFLLFIGFIALIVCFVLQLTVGVSAVWWLVSAMALFTGITESSIGVAGLYLERIYDEVKGRPLYIVKERINSGSAAAGQKGDKKV